jgi:hypothetical protein
MFIIFFEIEKWYHQIIIKAQIQPVQNISAAIKTQLPMRFMKQHI